MSLEKTIEVNNLIDLYGKFLTKKQLNIVNDYFKYDCSLSEIADNLNITKQAVKYSINLSLEKLQEYDNLLHLGEIKEKLILLLPQTNEEVQYQLQSIINLLGE